MLYTEPFIVPLIQTFMKIFGFKKLIFLLFTVFVLFSCEDKVTDNNVLIKALDLAESDPAKALDLLHAINNPENMSNADYMQYLVTLVQTKYKTGQDITSDTLIFEAQRYFEAKNNPDLTTKAQLYAGLVYEKRQIYDKAIQCYLKSEQNAKESMNNLFIGRSLNNIGYVYFQQDIMDSAIIYYKKALDCFEAIPNSISSQLVIITNIASAYEVENNLEIACVYLNKGTDLARKSNNIEYQAKFLHLYGNVYFDTKEYGKAIDYLTRAVKITANPEDSLKIYLNLSKTYNAENHLDSANYYKRLVESRLPEINDKYMLRSVYGAFSDYHKETGNYKEALRYSGLEKEINEKIQAENKTKELYEADKKMLLQQHQKRVDEYTKEQNWLLVLFSFGLLLIFCLMAYLFFTIRRISRKQRENVELLELYYRLKLNEIKEIDRSADEYKELAFLFLISNKDAKLQKFLPSGEPILRKNNHLRPVEPTLSMFDTSTDEQNILWAKKFFNEVIYCGELIANLSDRQVLFFALRSIGFSDEEIATVNNMSVQEVLIRQNELEVSLLNSGLAKDQINTFLHKEL